MKRTALFAWLLLAAAPALAKSGDANMSGKRELAMEHCPSAVPGAKTTVSDVPGGVAVTVRAPHDGVAQAEIHDRVQYQLRAKGQAAPARGTIEHTGMGTGSGRFGFCPGMVTHATREVQWLPDGAKLTVRAEQPADAARLQATTRQRAQALSQRMHERANR